MKISTEKIEGYENMTAEEKLAALENYEFEVPNTEEAKLKNLLNKANSEAASYKKALKELQDQKLTDDEKAKLEREESEKALKEELATLKKSQAIAEYKANYLANGYDEELATKTAEALFSGDMTTVFANQKTFAETVKAKAKEELLNSNPDLSKGNPPKGDENDPNVDAFKRAMGL